MYIQYVPWLCRDGNCFCHCHWQAISLNCGRSDFVQDVICHKYLCIYKYKHIYIHIYVHTYMYVYIYMYVCISHFSQLWTVGFRPRCYLSDESNLKLIIYLKNVCVCVCVRVCVCLCINIYIYMYMCVSECISNFVQEVICRISMY
jgi:hypothetical protein